MTSERLVGVSILLLFLIITLVPVSKGAHVTGIYLGGEKQFEVVANYSGVISDAFVQEGSKVQKGSHLFKIVDPVLNDNVIQLQRQLVQLDESITIQSDLFRRTRQLVDGGLSALLEAQSSELQLRRLILERENVNTQLGLLTTRKNAFSIVTSVRGGQVNNVKVHVGQVISPGTLLAYISPDITEPVFEIYAAPSDIGVLNIGQLVELRFSSLPRKSSPLLMGELASISSAPIINPQDRNTGKDQIGEASMYRGVVVLKKGELDKLTDYKISQGMPIEATIETGKQTIFDYIVTPFAQLFSRAFMEH